MIPLRFLISPQRLSVGVIKTCYYNIIHPISLLLTATAQLSILLWREVGGWRWAVGSLWSPKSDVGCCNVSPAPSLLYSAHRHTRGPSLHDIYTHVTSPTVPCSRKMNIDVEIQMLDVLPLLNI